MSEVQGLTPFGDEEAIVPVPVGISSGRGDVREGQIPAVLLPVAGFRTLTVQLARPLKN